MSPIICHRRRDSSHRVRPKDRHTLDERDQILGRAEREVAEVTARADEQAARVVRRGVRTGRRARRRARRSSPRRRSGATRLPPTLEQHAAAQRAAADDYAREVMQRLEEQLERWLGTVREGLQSLPRTGAAAWSAAQRLRARPHAVMTWPDRGRIYCATALRDISRARTSRRHHAASQAKNLKAPPRLSALPPRPGNADAVPVPALPPAAHPAPRLPELRPLSRPRSGRHRVIRGAVGAAIVARDPRGTLLSRTGQPGRRYGGRADRLPIAVERCSAVADRRGLDLRAALHGRRRAAPHRDRPAGAPLRRVRAAQHPARRPRRRRGRRAQRGRVRRSELPPMRCSPPTRCASSSSAAGPWRRCAREPCAR